MTPVVGELCELDGRRKVFVRHLCRETIESEAEKLLRAFSQSTELPGPPTPIEDMLERFFGVHLGFDDLHRRFGRPSILAVLSVDTKGTYELLVDESLDPVEHPKKEGRFHFTVAHEVAHFHLHLPFMTGQIVAGKMVLSAVSPNLTRDSTQQRTPLEIQADRFAGCLLMPAGQIQSAWDELTDSLGPLTMSRTRNEDKRAPLAYCERRRNHPHLLDAKIDSLEPILIALARRFVVSKAAMEIRLRQLGRLLEDYESEDVGRARRERLPRKRKTPT